MHEELAAIDVTPLDQLMRLKAELDTLEQRLQVMEERRASVAEAVYRRVRADYEARRQKLDQEAAPLKDAAREQYVKLHALLSRSEADHEAARLDREEIDFRHSLGEFDQAEYERRIAAVDEQLAARAAVREKAAELRQRFIAAFRSEDELRAVAPVAPAAAAASSIYDTQVPPSAPPPAAATIPPPLDVATRRLTPLDPAQLAPRPPEPTQVLGVPNPPASAPPSPAADVGATQTMRVLKGDPATAPRADQTVIIRAARLVPQNPEAGKLTHTVGLKPVTLGCAEDCDIRVPGAAPRHAEIRVSMAGYTISDLGGGVRINGAAIEQHLLRHDDAIDIGPARFVFREG